MPAGPVLVQAGAVAGSAAGQPLPEPPFAGPPLPEPPRPGRRRQSSRRFGPGTWDHEVDAAIERATFSVLLSATGLSGP